MESIITKSKFHPAGLIAGGFLAAIVLISPRVAYSQESSAGTSKVARPFSAGSLSDNPSVQELEECQLLAGPLVGTPGQAPAPGENSALSAALRNYINRSEPDDFSAITGFLDAYPHSTWKVSLLSNLGMLYYRTGYFDKAMDAWEAAWNLGKSSTDPALKDVTDSAVAQFAKMNARLGRFDRLKSLFSELKGRKLGGSAAQNLLGAREARWVMLNRSEIAFRCGPLAIKSIAKMEKLPMAAYPLIAQCKSTQKGTSLTALKKLADSIGLKYQVAKRTPGAAILLPAVVHWKAGHYGALLAGTNGRYELQDPTFGERLSVTLKALDAEASGYFLVPAGKLPPGWQTATLQEASSVWGKGIYNPRDPNCTCPTCQCATSGGGSGSGPLGGPDSGSGCPSCGSPPAIAMPSYTMHTMLVSLLIQDTPLLFRQPVGPALNFSLFYSQRGILPADATYSSLSNYSNLGPQWSFSWLSFISDDPSDPTPCELELYVRGGGINPYEFEMGSSTSDPQVSNGSILTIISSGSAPSYVINYSDGSQDYFNTTTSAAGCGRMVFLTKTVDPRGNQLSLSYSGSNPKLASISGSTGSLSFSYNLDNTIASVTASNAMITGSSWSASFGYTSGTLTSITDAQGMTSSFGYNNDGSGFISSMTTPYGTTIFSGTDSENDSNNYIVRWLQATDPLGATERLESREGAPGIASSDGTNTVPQGLVLSPSNGDLNDRNSFYWSKKAYMDAPGDYTKAKITHFLYMDDGVTESAVAESIKAPLEDRVWYQYPGQTESDEVGTLNQPNAVARVLNSSNPSTTTQIFQYQYNAAGNKTETIDPIGRTTTYAYASNGVDVAAVFQKNPTGSGTDPLGNAADEIAAYAYNTQHEVVTSTNAAGQLTTRSYNGQGQMTSQTVYVSGSAQTTTWNFDGNGYLTSRIGAITTDSTGFTYDNHNRVKVTTDSLGYTKTNAYDNLDRLTSVTYPDSSTDQTIYNRLDVEWEKDRSNRWTHYLHDLLGRLTYTVDPAGHSTQYQYCPCGTLTGIVDGGGNTTNFMLDVESRVTEKIFANASTIQYAYEPGDSRLQSVTDAKGQVTSYSYFNDNHLAGVSYSGSVATPSVAYGYDANYPRITEMSDSVSGATEYSYNPSSIAGTFGGGMVSSVANTGSSPYTLTFNYDELGRVVSRAIDGSTNNETTAYDALGRVTQVVNVTGTYGYSYNASNPLFAIDHINYPNGQVVQYGYYGSGTPAQWERLQAITNHGPVSDGTISQFNYAYDPAGDITSWTQQADSSPALSNAYGYDGASELLSAITTSSTGGNPLDAYSCRYDGAGNRLLQQINNTVSSAAYNNLNQVMSVSGTGSGILSITGSLNEPGTVTAGGTSVITDSNQNFSINVPVATGSNNIPITAADVSGTNVTNKTLGVNITSGTSIPSLQYDANGNLTSDGSRNYVWDAANRLVQIWYGSTGSSASTTMAYDALGRRIQIIEANSSGTATSIKNLIWDGATIREERNASNVRTKMYFQNSVNVSGSNYYYTRDHLGSVRELTDSIQNVQVRYDYDPYGHQTQLSGTVTADFGYAGYYVHQPSGLNLTLYRAYSQGLGRWISRDPIGIVSKSIYPVRDAEMFQGPNLYEFVFNNPVKETDPYGLCCINGLQGFVLMWYQAYYNGDLETCRASMASGFGGLVAGTAGAAVTGGDPAAGLAAAMMYGVIKCKQTVCVAAPFRY